VLAVYTGAVVDGVQDAGDDLVELGWFARNELPELAFPHDREILEAMGKGQ
jgi:hypothetical protein